MSTYVFMKVLESAPERYDRGMDIITLGVVRKIKEKISSEFIKTGDTILEIGCGTGSLTLLMAERGCMVTGIDIDKGMLGVAERKIEKSPLKTHIRLLQLSALQLDSEFESSAFDHIVSTLCLSEMSDDEINLVLKSCYDLLKSGGTLILADEVVPETFFARIVYYLLKIPVQIVTFFLARSTTRALKGIEGKLTGARFKIKTVSAFLNGSIKLIEGGKEALTTA